mgnify:CR=1 FL=1
MVIFNYAIQGLPYSPAAFSVRCVVVLLGDDFVDTVCTDAGRKSVMCDVTVPALDGNRLWGLVARVSVLEGIAVNLILVEELVEVGVGVIDCSVVLVIVASTTANSMTIFTSVWYQIKSFKFRSL